MTVKTDPYADSKARGEALGWTWVSDDACPRRLLGKRCRNGYPAKTAFEPCETCWCTRFRLNDRLNDHGNTWEHHRGFRFVLWEPYGAHGDDLAELIAVAKQDGLRVDVCPSVWNPPHTVGIRFRRNERLTEKGQP